MKTESFHSNLKNYMNDYVHSIYQASRKFPKEEIFGVTSQLRRSALSVILNYVEGYARMRSKVYRNFLEIAYGSLQESKYLLQFSADEKYLSQENLDKLNFLADKIGAMTWGLLRKL